MNNLQVGMKVKNVHTEEVYTVVEELKGFAFKSEITNEIAIKHFATLEELSKFFIYEVIPTYKHTISEEETTFVASHNNKDFYYRYNGMHHMIDVRYSNEPPDYVSWVVANKDGGLVNDNFMNSVIPRWIQLEAVSKIDVSF